MEQKVNSDYVRHMQGLIQIPTLSSTNDETTDFKPFFQLHKYLEDTYPLIHKNMSREVIGHASLLFHWKSPHPTLPPLLFMAHQDVVPVGDPNQWTHPPFAAQIADECIWGRGTTDCKGVMLSELEAVEDLFAKGLTPNYDIYLSFGHNEEVTADKNTKGAALVAAELAKRHVTLGCIVDEGGSISYTDKKVFTGYIAQVALAEKGFNDYELSYDCAGGHSSRPGQKGSALGAVARGITAVEENLFPYRLTPLIRMQLKAMAHYQEKPVKDIFDSPDKHMEELTELAHKDSELDAILHTTMAVTMASGSQQSNVLPSHASAIVNCRLLQGDTSESVLAYIQKHVPPYLKVRHIYGESPAPMAEIDLHGPLQTLTDTLKELYGQETVIVPSLLAGGTDSRFYSHVCQNTFRFGSLLRDKRWGKPHGVNEKIPCDALGTGVAFFQTFLRKYNERTLS